MSLPFAYGTCPPQSSLRISLGPCGFCSDSEYAFIMLCISYDGPSDHFRSTDDTSPVGPCDACQFTSTRSISTLRLASTGRSCLFRLCSSRESASPVSCWIVLGYQPSEVSPCSRRKVLSDLAVLHAVFQSCDCRGSEDFSYRTRCVLQRQRYSHRSWVAPLLVVHLPFEDGFRPRPTLLPDSSLGLLS